MADDNIGPATPEQNSAEDAFVAQMLKGPSPIDHEAQQSHADEAEVKPRQAAHMLSGADIGKMYGKQMNVGKVILAGNQENPGMLSPPRKRATLPSD